MKFGYVLVLVASLCCQCAFSLKGLSADNGESKAIPDTSDTEAGTIGDPAAIHDTSDTEAGTIGDPAAIPDTSDTEASTIGDPAAIPDDQPTWTNLSSLTDLDNNNNDSLDNSSGAILREDDLTSIPLSGSRRLGSSRYKNGRQQVSINDLTLSEDVPRHGALRHKNLAKLDVDSGARPDTGDKSGLGLDTSDNAFKRKRRIPTSSATPSVQIVILVIGGVLLCVLLTGFIRWRVRGNLNAAKQKDSEDNCSNLGDIEMDVIYECECEESTAMVQDSESDSSDEEEGLKFNEFTCSHRFDAPLSIMSQSYSAGHHARMVRLKSPNGDQDLRLISGARRNSVSRRKYGSKGRYSRHQRKRLQNMFVQKLETIPMEMSAPPSEETNIASSRPGQANRNDENKEAANVRHPSPRLQQPSLLSRHSSPTPQRGVFASLLNTWRSLSFNRDWVGKMWQEQHNIRRISDVLRGLSSNKSSDSERSSRESLNSESNVSLDAERQTSRFSTIAEVDLSGLDPHSLQCHDNVHDINETPTDVPAAPHSGSNGSQQCGHLFSTDVDIPSCSGEAVLDYRNPGTANLATHVFSSGFTDVSQTDRISNQWTFSDCQEQPPEYETLLARVDHSRSQPLRISDDHPRYQRRHRRKWLEERRRPNTFLHTNVCCAADMSRAENHSVFTIHLDEVSPLSQIHRQLNQPVVASDDQGETSGVPTAASTHQTETTSTEEHVAGASPYVSSSTKASSSVAPFVPQEGVVIEQLSDGAQIVYIPPPALPSYHNDTPPPYQQ